MAKTDNLSDFLTDVANSIRTKTGTTEQINAQDFSNKILSIQTGGGGETVRSVKILLDATKSAYYLFNQYDGTTIPDGAIEYSDTSNVTTTQNMFKNCTNLTTIPLLDTSNVISMSYMFNGCSSLTTIPQLNTSNVIGMRDMFKSCSNLKSILMTNIGADLDISASTKFEREDLLVILNNLKTVTSATTLTMGATNLAKLTEEDKAIATNKGWTLA